MESGKSENDCSELNKILEYVNQISLELATAPHSQDIYSLITKKIREATGAMGLTFGDYDPEEQEVTLKHIESDSNLLNIAGKILGYSLMNVKASISETQYQSMVTNQVSYRKNLTEATFGEIPLPASSLFMKALNIGYFIGLAYVVEGKLYGTSVLAFKTDYPQPSDHLLKTLCNIAAVTLRRHRTESHLHQTIRALQISEERFRNIAEQLSDTIFLTDAHGTIIFLSPPAKHLFGYEPHEMLGKNFIQFLHIEDLKKALNRFRIAIQSNPDREPLILKMVRKDGEVFFGELVSKNVHDQGKVNGTLGIIRNITDRIRTQEELKSLYDDLERRVSNRTAELENANKELEAFSYSVSHDLRSPLRTMTGFSKVLLEENYEQLNDEGKLNLTRIIEAGDYMSQLIEDLLNLSRLHRASLNPVEIDLSLLVKQECDTLKSSEPHRIVEFDIQEKIYVKADKTLIHNAIQNLIHNAWKFTSKREKAHIKFGAYYEDEKQVIYIKDNGVGFDMKYYDKLFNPFQRLHPRHEFPGTGIGLASVKRIIAKHNGEIRAESIPDNGTTFYFRLGV